MLIIILALCLATSIFVAVRRKDSLSVYLLGMSVSNTVMLTGVVGYIAKMGGMAAQQRTFLFLVPSLQVWLQHVPISMDKLGYIVAIGRSLFPLFVLYAALDTTMIGFLRRRIKWLRLCAAIIPALSLVYYFPSVFRTLVRGRFWLLPLTIRISIVWIILYLLAALLIMIKEYRSITIPVFKRNYRYLLLSVISISVLYLLYASKDPAQIYNMFISEYIRLGITSYISPTLPALGWVVLVLCAIFFVALGGYSMMKYAQVDYQDDKEDLTLQRKIDAAGMGVSVFVHGIKNQLLSSRVLHKKLSRALGEKEVDLEQVKQYAAQLNDLNEAMVQHMDTLYSTVKASAISLKAVPVAVVLQAAVKEFHKKYPNQPVDLHVNEQLHVLADVVHLSEAIYNLMCNSYEAAYQIDNTPIKIELYTHAERMWTVLEVRDNGPGISAESQSKIFDPFFTSKNTNYNWGMGLFYVRKIVKSHMGKLRLDSKEGEGTSFFVMLPSFNPVEKE